MSADHSASVLARLLNRSRSAGENYNHLLSAPAVDPSRLAMRAHRSATVAANRATSGDGSAACRAMASSRVRLIRILDVHPV